MSRGLSDTLHWVENSRPRHRFFYLVHLTIGIAGADHLAFGCEVVAPDPGVRYSRLTTWLFPFLALVANRYVALSEG